jgi:acetyltransferase-like isoleucine patch superfamily enzyme
MSIGENVFIGDEVYLENEHPELVEIQSGVQISVRAIIIAHTRGAGRVVIEKDAFVGPNVVVATSGNRILRIGEGAVIGAGAVVTKSVPARVFVASAPPAPIATARVAFTKAETIEEFLNGLTPLRRPTTRGDASGRPARGSARRDPAAD